MIKKRGQEKNSQSSQSNSTELQSAIRNDQDIVHQFLDHQRFAELLRLNQSMTYKLQKYFSCVPEEGINARKDRLSLLYNRSLFFLQSGDQEEAENLLLEAIKDITEQIDEEKSRLGFMEDKVLLAKGCLLRIEEWQLELAVFYNYLGSASLETNSKEVALISGLKSIDLVSDIFRSMSKDIDETEFEQLQTIFELRDSYAHSKQLQNFDTQVLKSVFSWLIMKNHEQQPIEWNDINVFGQIARLRLNLNDKISLAQKMMKMRMIQCLSLFLLSFVENLSTITIEEYVDEDEDNGKTNNILFPAIMAIYIYKQYLPPIASVGRMIGNMSSQFQIKTSITHPLSFQYLLSELGLHQKNVFQKEPLGVSCSDNLKTLKNQRKDRKTKKGLKTGSKKKMMSPHFKGITSPLSSKQKQETNRLVFPKHELKANLKKTPRAYSPTDYYLGTRQNMVNYQKRTPQKQKARKQRNSQSKTKNLKNHLKKK